MPGEQYTINQHYVPQSYLRRFVGDDDRIFVFDKPDQRIFPSSPRNIASERYFYNLPPEVIAEENLELQSVEKALSDIETKFSETAEDLLEKIDNVTTGVVIEPNQKPDIAYFLLLQLLRTREYRDLQFEMVNKLANALAQEIADLNQSPYPIKVEIDEDWVALFQSGLMFDIEFIVPIIQILANHIWIIGVNETNQPFWASDNPVVTSQHTPGSSESYSYSGLASKGVEIAFPLTSHHILVLYDRVIFGHYRDIDCKSIKIKDKHIPYYNSLQVIQSNRQVYSSQANFDLAKEVCNTYPEVCDPDRTRTRIDLIDGHIVGQVGVR